MGSEVHERAKEEGIQVEGGSVNMYCGEREVFIRNYMHVSP